MPHERCEIHVRWQRQKSSESHEDEREEYLPDESDGAQE